MSSKEESAPGPLVHNQEVESIARGISSQVPMHVSHIQNSDVMVEQTTPVAVFAVAVPITVNFGAQEITQILHNAQIPQEERDMYDEIARSLCITENQEHSTTEGRNVTCCERCTDFCCQSCDCSFQNPLSRQRNKPLITGKKLLTPILQLGCKVGWGIYCKFAFPLVRDTVRDVWITAELVTVLIALILSIVSFAKGNQKLFNSIHLALSILSTVLSITDSIILLRKCRSCKACANCSQGEHENCLPTSKCNIHCKECGKKLKTVSDFLRVLLTELILYPLLICNISQFIIGDGYKGEKIEDRVSLALFALSLLALFLYVYFARILILIGMIYSVHKLRQQLAQVTDAGSNRQHNYSSIAKDALCYQLFFFLHVLGQMIVQLMMLVAIGAKIEHNNKEENMDCKPWQDICFSSTLWYMIIAGYILPISGFLTFFVVTFYWAMQFPIGLCVDLIKKMMKTPGVEALFYPEKHIKQRPESQNEYEALADCLNASSGELEKSFKEMQSTSFCEKFLYPFRSPLLIILCLFYATLQIAFVNCAASADTGPNEILNGGGWYIFYIIAIIIGILANLYTFAVAGFWYIIIGAIICIIYIIVSIFLLLLVLGLVAHGSRNNNQNNN